MVTCIHSLLFSHTSVQRKLIALTCLFIQGHVTGLWLNNYLADFGRIPFPVLIYYDQEWGVKCSRKEQNVAL